MSPSERRSQDSQRERSKIVPFKLLVGFGHAVNGFIEFLGEYSVVDEILGGSSGQEAHDRIVKRIESLVALLLVAWIILIILSIELIIPWNHITGAYSFDSGQWIILVAATCGILRVFWIWLRLGLERLPDDE